MECITWLSFWSGRCGSKARLEGKTAIVTGSNVGLGKETAQDFCKRGCRVIMACRNLEKAEKAKKDILEKLKNEIGIGVLIIRQLDLSSMTSVRNFADRILEEESSIHILVNNAGLAASSGRDKTITEDGFELTFATNYLGPFLLTLLLMPTMIKSAPARIVNVSSMAYTWGFIDLNDLQGLKNPAYSPVGYYARSKLAQILFTKELAKKLEGTGVTVYSVHPGMVWTNIWRNIDNLIASGSYFIVSKFLTIFMKSAELGAQTQIHCAVEESLAKESGLFYADCKPVSVLSKARDSAVSKQLWEISKNLVKIDDDVKPFQLN